MGLQTLDVEGNITESNHPERYRNYWDTPFTGRHFSCFYAPEDIEAGKPDEHLRKAADSGRYIGEGWRVREDGSRFWADTVITALLDKEGNVRGYSKVMRDVTERRQSSEAVEKLAAFARFNPNPVVEFDANGAVVFLNNAADKMIASLGLKDVNTLLPPDTSSIVRKRLATGRPRLEVEMDVHQRNLTWSFFPAGSVVHGYAFDITERRRAERQLVHDAFHDALTNLPNRSLFIDHLRLAIERTKRRDNYIFAVLLLDLDRFKVINDNLGHDIGDQLLKAFAERLKSTLRPGDTTARFGGDEFAVLLEDLHDLREAIIVIERIQDETKFPFTISGQEVFTSCSIGVAFSSASYTQSAEMLRDVDTALERTKLSGTGGYEIFDRRVHARALHLLSLENDLRRALERKEFYLDYQPIVPLDSGQICGFEALVRWRHIERGVIPPVEFIPVAEKTGIILQIGEWVMREACQQMSQWQKLYASSPKLSISVNLCSRQFSQSNMVEQIRRILDETELDPSTLKLEITEGVMMEDTVVSDTAIAGLASLGVSLDIDDFGTGYSSLSYLHCFPVKTLKIDRSFVSRLDDSRNFEVVQTIIMLARNLGIEVIAEGIETIGQLAQLKALGCKYGQGYLFSRPVDPVTAAAMINQPLSPTSPVERSRWSIGTNFIDSIESMTKREYGRLQKEIRNCLIEAGFQSSKITPMTDAQGKKIGAFRSPGFKIDKFKDGRSIKLSVRLIPPGDIVTTNWIRNRLTYQKSFLKQYNAVLERAGYICFRSRGKEDFDLYSLWRKPEIIA